MSCHHSLTGPAVPHVTGATGPLALPPTALVTELHPPECSVDSVPHLLFRKIVNCISVCVIETACQGPFESLVLLFGGTGPLDELRFGREPASLPHRVFRPTGALCPLGCSPAASDNWF